MSRSSKVIYETKYYFITIGSAELTDSSAPMYKVINKEHSFTEVEATTLPDVIEYANHLSTELDRIYNTKNNEEIQTHENNLN